MEKRTTKREYFTAIKAVPEVAANEEFVKFIDHEIELLDRKVGKGGKPTATQVANEGLKADILEVLSETEGMTVTQIIATGGSLGGLSNQKVSALLRLMANNDNTVRIEKDKKKTLFFKA